jgi:hypothetical protein
MRKHFLTAFVLAAMLVFATSAFALEKTATLMDDSRIDGWNAGTSCNIAYYNFCTGWVWIWSGWSPGDKVAVCYSVADCCESDHATLTANSMYVWTAAPSGYGFTGTIEVSEVDGPCCKGVPIAVQEYLPVSGWNTYLWGVQVKGDFLIQAQIGDTIVPNPIAYATDHPAAGPTGPVACGTCYPTTRDARSYYMGTKATPLCPGSPLNDGICDAALLWSAHVVCKPISVEEDSWGKVKSLYR